MSSYFFIVTFAPVTQESWLFNVVHFSTSILAPVASVVSECDLVAYYKTMTFFASKIRAAMISVNVFSLLCDDDTGEPTLTSLGSISKFGGPILYLFVYMFVLFAILVWVDSGSIIFWRRTSPLSRGLVEKTLGEDVTSAATAVASSDDALRVLGISKSYNGKRVLDDVSLGVSKDDVFALLGPNGAGKTTTFNIIRKNFLHRYFYFLY